jgi:N-hydroxyarylamine O-acetyltransferase
MLITCALFGADRRGRPDEIDAVGLEAVQRAHRMNIGFENLDVMLGRGVSVDPDAIFGKLVMGARGGYCFEHNALFGDMLGRLGFDNRPLLARVFLGLPEDAAPPPMTHTFRLVDLDGQAWIADAGFGGSYVPAMPLTDGARRHRPMARCTALPRATRAASWANGWLNVEVRPTPPMAA